MAKIFGLIAALVGVGWLLGPLGSDVAQAYGPLLALAVVVVFAVRSRGRYKRGSSGWNALVRFPGPTKKLAAVVAGFGVYDLAASQLTNLDVHTGWTGLVAGLAFGVVISMFGDKRWALGRARWMILERVLLYAGCGVAMVQFLASSCGGPSPLSFVRASPDPYYFTFIVLFMILACGLLVMSMAVPLGGVSPAFFGSDVRANLAASVLLVLEYVISVAPYGWPSWLTSSTFAIGLGALAISSVLRWLEAILSLGAAAIWLLIVGANVPIALEGGACGAQSVGAICFLVGGGVAALLAKGR